MYGFVSKNVVAPASFGNYGTGGAVNLKCNRTCMAALPSGYVLGVHSVPAQVLFGHVLFGYIWRCVTCYLTAQESSTVDPLVGAGRLDTWKRLS
jgi:hypothetical protein